MNIYYGIILILVLVVIYGGMWHILSWIHRNKSKVSFYETFKLTGLPIITFSCQGKTLNFILDTGSTTSILDENIVRTYDLEFHSLKNTQTSGLDGIVHKTKAGVFVVDFKSNKYAMEAIIKDMTSAFTPIKKAYGNIQLHGLLGSDFLERYKYQIDFKNYVAYCKK